MATSEAQKRANKKWREKNPEKLASINNANYWKMKIENPVRLKEIRNKSRLKYLLKPEFKNQQRIRHQISELFRRRGYRRMCEICESYKTEIHHQDYNDSYDIIFLCHKCHMALHKLLKGTDEDPQILYERQIISN